MQLAASLDVRCHIIAEYAALWRDPSSPVRAQARSALAGGRWPAPVVERALDNVLFDLDEARARELTQALSGRPVPTLVILPGNIIGPAVSSAFCAALAGSPVMLKAASEERHLARIAAEQLDGLAGAVSAQHWRGGETEPEAEALDQVERVIAFGSDETLDALRSRINARLKSGIPHFVPYGDSYSVGYVNASAELTDAAAAAARDVCLFDQRGCMSPQTIYVRGDAGRATLFARALAAALEREGRALPRAALEEAEPVLIASFLRRCAVTALEAVPHGLNTILKGPAKSGMPEFVVVVEPDGAPTCAGFGRIVAVKPCGDAATMLRDLASCGRPLETIGTAGVLAPEELAASPARRQCELGKMQRPPFGYRPTVLDFCKTEGA
jgi:hypothetical protein